MSNILREFERLALVNPGIELELSHNDVIVHQLPNRHSNSASSTSSANRSTDSSYR